MECVERGLNPLTTNLVVADADRSRKTICLAVSPSLKSYGLPGRPRLFEVVQKVNEANLLRKKQARLRDFKGKAVDDLVLQANADYAIDYLVATPRMALYLEYSTEIYGIYLNYAAPEDIHVYSIDEVFLDVTAYLGGQSPRELVMTILQDVLKTTGITATAGIGTNLYLAKIAMDIVAKRNPPDRDGVRVAELDEMSYRRLLWNHRPITDFWRVGKGYAARLEKAGLFTMGDIARCSLGKAHEDHNENLLYKLFGVNAELLIDHAWGWEPCTIADIKAYKPGSKSLGSGQVLPRPYSVDQARLVVHEMTDLLVLDLADKGLLTDQMVLTLHYDCKNMQDPKLREKYAGAAARDNYGREIPKHSRGTANLEQPTALTSLIVDAVLKLYDRLVRPGLLIRKINVTAKRVIEREDFKKAPKQLSLFSISEKGEAAARFPQKEKQVQKAILTIQKKFGKNSILKGMNLLEEATARDKNERIGGHKA